MSRLHHIDLRRAGARALFVRVLDDGTEEPRDMGAIIREERGLLMLEQPSGICVTVKPWADGTVHSWFESRGRADAEAQWMARGGGL